MKRLWLTAAVLAIGLPLARAADDGWTRFRGPNGTGVVEGKFAVPTADDIAWKVELPGKGHASPIIWKDRIYTTSADVEEGKRYILAISTKDGSIVWKKEYDFSKYRQHADNSFASATPVADELGIYVAWSTPESYTLLSLDHEGKERWTNDLGAFKSIQGQGASPIVVDDAVILTNDQEGPKSSLHSFDRRTGAELWKLDRPSSDKTAMSTPVVYRPGGAAGAAQIIVTSKAAGLSAIDPKTGQVIWEAGKAFDARTVGSPVVAGNLIVGACGEGGEHRLLVAIRPPMKEGDEPTIAYEVKRVAPYIPTPLVKGDRLYMWGDDGRVTCVETATGKEIWSEKVGGQYYGSPILVGNTLWCASRKGDLIGVVAGEEFKKVAKIELGEPSHATPAFAGGKMYVRTVSHLFCLKMAAQ